MSRAQQVVCQFAQNRKLQGSTDMTEKLDIPQKELYALRLDPQLKYLAEIAARSQRRSLANFVEWAIAKSLHYVPISNAPDAPSVADMGSTLWDIDRATRIKRLADNCFDLLTYAELNDLKSRLTSDELKDLRKSHKIFPPSRIPGLR